MSRDGELIAIGKAPAGESGRVVKLERVLARGRGPE
jgi:hypothetical protein